MPFESKAQLRYMFAKHPEMAKEFASKTENMKSLPEHKRKILLQYPFITQFLEGRITPQIFLENLRAFKPDLIKKGITEADIMSLEDKLK